MTIFIVAMSLMIVSIPRMVTRGVTAISIGFVIRATMMIRSASFGMKKRS